MGEGNCLKNISPAMQHNKNHPYCLLYINNHMIVLKMLKMLIHLKFRLIVCVIITRDKMLLITFAFFSFDPIKYYNNIS